MALIRKINSGAKEDANSGYGSNNSMYGGRLINRDGKPNVHKTGLDPFQRISWYHTLIDEMPIWKFLLAILSAFLFINLVFAIAYYIIGVENLVGMAAKTPLQKFIEAFFFSAQTFTTVGYGRISPSGYFASLVAAIEAFFGLLFFAVATGLFYARFSRPQAFVKFSRDALLAPYRNGIAFMFRIVPYKNNSLIDAEVVLSLMMVVEENGVFVNRFYPLQLELSRVNTLNLSWTVVHPITATSPLFGLKEDDLKNYKAEFLVFIKAFDDVFSNTVVAKSSYMHYEIVWGAKFLPMFHKSKDDRYTVLDLDKLNDHTAADISYAFTQGQVEANP